MEELAGYVYKYNQDKATGCFFIDKDMINIGLAIYNSSDKSENCYTQKYD